MPVGVLVGLVKVAMQVHKQPLLCFATVAVDNPLLIALTSVQNGHKKYTPLDLSAIPPQMPQPIEPARLEARASEYYRRMPSRSGGRDSTDRRDRDRGSSRRDEDRDTRDRGYSRRDDDRDSRDRSYSRRDDHSRDHSREREHRRDDRYTQPEPTVSKDRALEEDNVGHQMLKGMGWKEGSGLGSKGSGEFTCCIVVAPTCTITASKISQHTYRTPGIAAPIDDGGQGARDKGGVGSRVGSSSDMVEQYRQMRSKGYHDKIVQNP